MNQDQSLRIARAINNPESFSTTIKPFIARMSRQGVSIGKRNSFILKIFNKHQVDFNVCQGKQEVLNLVSYIINTYFFIHPGQPITSVAISMPITR